MAPSFASGIQTTSVCQTCGGKGDPSLLIYCVNCHDSAVHHYCLSKFSPDDDNVTWMCEECAPKLPKVGPSRISERINLRNDRAVEVRINWKKKLYKNGSSTAKRSAGVKDGLFEAALITGSSLPIEDKNSQISFDDTSGSQGHRKQRRRLMLEDGDSSEVKTNVSPSTPSGHNGPLNISYSQLSVEPDNHLFAQPVIDPIWGGRFSINSGKNEIFVGLLAHLSSKACSKVHDVANALPPVLDIEILPRCNIWPKSFQKSPPTDDNIALYFFPESERDEKVFESLLDDIIELNLSLKALIGDAELLVFSSRDLPPQHWRFRRKYYLWGVFRRQQNSLHLVPAKSHTSQSRSTECVTTQLASDDLNCFSLTAIPWSPNSPISTSSSHVSNSPNYPLLHKPKSSSPDFLSSNSSKLTRHYNTEQGRDKVWSLKTDQKRGKEGKRKAYELNSPQPETKLYCFVKT